MVRSTNKFNNHDSKRFFGLKMNKNKVSMLRKISVDVHLLYLTKIYNVKLIIMIFNLSCEVGFRRKFQSLRGYVVNRAEGLTVTARAGVCKLISNIINTMDRSKRQPSEEWFDVKTKKSHSEKSLQANRAWNTACINFGLAFQRSQQLRV